MNTFRFYAICLAFVFIMNSDLHAQKFEANYDESRIPEYQLPDPLKFENGKPVAASDWPNRRAEILDLFKLHVYGVMPRPDQSPKPKVIGVREFAAEFKIDPGDRKSETVRGRLQEVTLGLHSTESDRLITARLLVVLPDVDQRCPLFLAYNFQGNHTIDSCKEITLGKVWNRDQTSSTAQESTRGAKSSRWPLGFILSHGFGVATLYYGDVDPDFHDEFKNGVHGLFPDLQNRPDNWTSIGAWAWGLHRVMDYLETDTAINSDQVVLLGHSRLGKTALWAGATDSRYSIVISNNSGCGGAALARRAIGETVQRITTVFPHWFCRRHVDYSRNESKLPVDQHQLISLIAPRPVYVASAIEDRWADPRGEFISAKQASPVYERLGLSGVLAGDWPQVDNPVGGHIGYHVRSGGHDVKRYDWEQFINFANRHFKQ